MKKYKLLILLIMILGLSTGCVKSTTTLSVGADKTVVINGENLIIDTIYDESLLDLTNFIKNGGTVQKKSEDGYTGIVFSKKYENIDDISSSKDKEIIISDYLNKDFDDKILFKVKSGFFKNIYYANFKYNAENNNKNADDLTDTDNSESSFDFSNIDSLKEMPEFKYVVNLPKAAINNNATTVSEDGTILTWNIDMLKTSDIYFSFELINTNNIIFLIASIIVVLGTIIFLTVFLNRHKDDHIDPVLDNDESEILKTSVIVDEKDKMSLNEKEL